MSIFGLAICGSISANNRRIQNDFDERRRRQLRQEEHFRQMMRDDSAEANERKGERG